MVKQDKYEVGSSFPRKRGAGHEEGARLLSPPVGGAFQFPGGYGIVIDEGISLLLTLKKDGDVEDDDMPKRIKGKKVRTFGYKKSIRPTPKNVSVIDLIEIPLVIDFMLRSLRDVLNHLNKEDRKGVSKRKTIYM